jgi:hypothetical protein
VEGRVEGYVFKHILAEEGGGGGRGPTEAPPRAGKDLPDQEVYGPLISSQTLLLWVGYFVVFTDFLGKYNTDFECI